MDFISPKVKEAWFGPGRKDGTIKPLTPKDDAYHSDKKGMYEWWYFDAHLEGGYTVVAFFHASNPNPGTAGKTGVELTLLRPDGRKTHKFIKYPKSAFAASREEPSVQIGENYMKVDYSQGELPIYEIFIDEDELCFHLTYESEVKGWKPGDGLSQFGDMGYFAWVLPFPRAKVSGTIRDGETTIEVSGIGYHDHNWLDFQFQRIIEYWMWGRIYSENFTISYAFIQCNKKMDHHAVKVLMVAQNEDVFLSTGEFDFIRDDYLFDERNEHRYPQNLTIKIPDQLEVNLTVNRVLEAEDMLAEFNPVLRFLARYALRMQPGYFRLLSDFEINVVKDGISYKEGGTTLHEIVAFKPIE